MAALSRTDGREKDADLGWREHAHCLARGAASDKELPDHNLLADCQVRVLSIGRTSL